MKSTASVTRLALAAPALLLAACVTINIYFPAAAAEKMADKIIDEVWQAQKNVPAAPAKTETPTVAGEEKQ
ncbi:MAG: hypothetical protein KUL75_09160 [Sterolibacterium sp.]|nr:hypothetical protein [Sterolibacterium sp.]